VGDISKNKINIDKVNWTPKLSLELFRTSIITVLVVIKVMCGKFINVYNCTVVVCSVCFHLSTCAYIHKFNPYFSHGCVTTSYIMTEVGIKFILVWLKDLPCFTAFLFFGPYSNLKFIILLSYTWFVYFFVT